MIDYLFLNFLTATKSFSNLWLYLEVKKRKIELNILYHSWIIGKILDLSLLYILPSGADGEYIAGSDRAIIITRNQYGI